MADHVTTGHGVILLEIATPEISPVKLSRLRHVPGEQECRHAMRNDLQCVTCNVCYRTFRVQALRVVVIRAACAVVNDSTLRRQRVATVTETMAGSDLFGVAKYCGRADSPAATRIY
jgi:hypothetical protein